MLNDNTTNGYVIFDLLGVDLTAASQNITGIYKRVKDVFEADKPIIMAVDNIPPFAVTAKKVSNYYELVSEFYVFDINTNDILIIRPNSGTFTEVTITPSLLSGTKIADYSVGETSGSLYAPTQQTEINDSTASDHTTYSSDKINTLLSGKVDTGTVAVIDDLIPSTTTVFSSQKVIDGLTDYYDLTASDIKNIVATGFSTESSYSVGDYCIYGSKLYRFTSVKTAGAWDSTKVTLVNVGSELKSKSNIKSVNSNTISAYVGFHSLICFSKYIYLFLRTSPTYGELVEVHNGNVLCTVNGTGTFGVIDFSLSGGVLTITTNDNSNRIISIIS